MEHAVRWEWIKISRSQLTDYGSTTMAGDDCQAKIAYNRDGSINEMETYSDSYRRKHHLGEFADKGDDGKKSSSSKNKSSNNKSPSTSSHSSSSREEHVPEPISESDRALLKSCFSIPDKEHVFEVVGWMYDHYFKSREIYTEISSDTELKEKALDFLKDSMCDIEIPVDLAELFGLAVVVNYYHDKKGGAKTLKIDNVFGGLNVTKQSRNSIYSRIKDILISNERFYDEKVYDFLTVIPDDYYEDTIFLDVCEHYCKELMDEKSVDAMYKILYLYEEQQTKVYPVYNALSNYPLPSDEDTLLSVRDKLTKSYDFLKPLEDNTDANVDVVSDKIRECETNICELRIQHGTPNDLKNLFDSIEQFTLVNVASYINKFPVPSDEQALIGVVDVFKEHGTEEELKQYRKKVEEIQAVIKELYSSNSVLMEWCDSQERALTIIDAKKYKTTKLYSAIAAGAISLGACATFFADVPLGICILLVIVALLLWLSWYMIFNKDYSTRIPVLKQWAEAYKKTLDMGIDL